LVTIVSVYSISVFFSTNTYVKMLLGTTVINYNCMSHIMLIPCYQLEVGKLDAHHEAC